MSASSGSKLLAYVAGAGALGYGAYFAVQQKEVLKHEKEAADIAALLDKEKKKAVQTSQLIKEHEERLSVLAKQETAVKADLKKAEDKLKAAQAEVSRLQGEVTRAASERGGLLSRLTSLRSDSERSKEAMVLSEANLKIARQRVAEAKAQLNPLNSPLLKGSGKR